MTATLSALDELRELVSEAAAYAGPTDDMNGRLWQQIEAAEKALRRLNRAHVRLRRLQRRWDSDNPRDYWNSTDAANAYTEAVRALP